MTFCYEFCDLEIFAFAAKIAAFYYLSAKRDSMKFTKFRLLFNTYSFIFAIKFCICNGISITKRIKIISCDSYLTFSYKLANMKKSFWPVSVRKASFSIHYF